MPARETLKDFYLRHGEEYMNLGQFNVARIENVRRSQPFPYNRRDFYKITLATKIDGLLVYADRSIRIKNPALIFSNPMTPWSWEPGSESVSGYVCVFTENFISDQLKAGSLAHAPLFNTGGNLVLFPDKSSVDFCIGFFEHMLREMQSAYTGKYEMLRNYVQIILHESLRITPPDQLYQTGTSSTRISARFLGLLERQFPIASPKQIIRLKNANEFAAQLMIHTNHLNKALKEATGRTTTEHIAEKMIKEAKALLLHSSWDIAEISYCLGFNHAPNFNIFFKKHTGQTPNHFRNHTVAIS
jgi:AraC family transcriptional activator of pobA